MTTTPRLRIGTRGSPLARAQSELAASALRAAFPELEEAGALEIVVIRTTGDHVLDRPLAELGGKGLFTKEIEEALADRRIDVAVHSMKDVPTHLPDGLVIGAMLAREDPRDVLVARGARRIDELARGAHVGTASLRREAQLRARRPDLRVAPLRGNVATRLAKVEGGEVDATLLALAGLRRLGREVPGAVLEPAEMLPAVGQGAVGLECREGDARTRAWLEAVDDAATSLCVGVERAMLEALDGSCRTPIGGLATLEGGQVRLEGLVASPDGRICHRDARSATVAHAHALGRELGLELRARIGPELFERG